ncbi:MAG: Flp pilus assembly protein CpaB [Solirubrobacterales bacterium]
MKSRGLVVVLALILATVATAGVFLYARGVKEDARTGGSQVEVVVASDDIPANTDLNSVISQGGFVLKEIPQDALVEGAITEISQLRNRRNNVFIVAGEQIPISRVQGGKVEGGVLSIPEGHQAITVSLESPRAVGAAIAGGDNVTVLATFSDVVIEQKKKAQQTTPTGQPQAATPTAATVVLVPQVEVLRVFVPTTTGTTGGEGSADTTGNIAVTLAFLPEEAQKFVFALEQGKVYLSLLPPDAEGVELAPLTVDSIVNPPKAKGSA